MRGEAPRQANIMLAITPDQLVPADHPIREIKRIVDGALVELSPLFEAIYARNGRPSTPPEHLIKAQLLIALFSVRGMRAFCEQLRYNMLFKWFLDLNVDDEPFDASTYSKNQERLMSAEIAQALMQRVGAEAHRRQLLSAEHFTVDGTYLDAWASLKSVHPKDGSGAPRPPGKNPSVNYRGQRRKNETHRSTTDPDARLAKRGDRDGTRLCLAGHVLMENRNGLVVDATIARTAGAPEWEMALRMLERLPPGRKTVGGDSAYDNRGFVRGTRAIGVTPHVTQVTPTPWRGSAIDKRTTRHACYLQSLKKRKRVEEIFGWLKTVGGGRKLRYIGLDRNQLWLTLAVTAYNLVRMARIQKQALAT